MMHITNTEYPINLYGDNATVEDWLCNFTVVVRQESTETPPPAKTNPLHTIACATFTPTKIGELVITRDMLVAMFTDKEVREQEQNASIVYLEENPT